MIYMKLFFGEEILGEVVQDDTIGYVGLLTWQKVQTKAEGTEEELPLQLPELTEEEATRLAIAASKLEEMRKWQGLVVQLREFGSRTSAPSRARKSVAPSCTYSTATSAREHMASAIA
jgi:hypothetical protein